jgi:signal transduction histidine kinase
MVISAIRDVTARKLAEKQIGKLNHQLEEALRRSDKLAATGRLVATIAHEINNPLESLGNLLYVLGANPTLDDSGKEMVEAAKQEVGRLSNLSRQTLAPHRETKSPLRHQLRHKRDHVDISYGRSRSGILVAFPLTPPTHLRPAGHQFAFVACMRHWQ